MLAHRRAVRLRRLLNSQPGGNGEGELDSPPITVPKLEVGLDVEERIGGGAGLGAELQGSSPSESYTECASGLSITKLPPKLFAVEYGCMGLGALNMLAALTRVHLLEDDDDGVGSK